MSGKDAWREFLAAKGTLHIIADLGAEQQRFTNHKERITIGNSTLNRRLKQKLWLDMWKLDLRSQVHHKHS
jgi:DNA-binding HxlR family transcriptional regulator